MNSTTVIRLLILVIPAVWVIIRLMPVDHPQYNNLRIAAQQSQNEHGHQEADSFLRYESGFKAHYESHYATSGYDFNHYRQAYKYGFDLSLDQNNRKIGWNTLEPQARQNWNERIMGPWSRHSQAVRYGWEQGLQMGTSP